MLIYDDCAKRRKVASVSIYQQGTSEIFGRPVRRKQPYIKYQWPQMKRAFVCAGHVNARIRPLAQSPTSTWVPPVYARSPSPMRRRRPVNCTLRPGIFQFGARAFRGKWTRMEEIDSQAANRFYFLLLCSAMLLGVLTPLAQNVQRT
jgi:hypothetical protein